MRTHLTIFPPLGGGPGIPASKMPMPGTDADAYDTRSPLTDAFPVTQLLSGGFSTIAIPAGFTVPAGHSAWYPLIDFDPQQELGQDIALFGVTAQLASTNNTDGGSIPVTDAAWGSKIGTKAAIVVGQRLPLCNPGADAWTTGYCAVPTLGGNIVEASLAYMWSTSFPVGSWRDAIPFKETSGRTFVPYVYRIPQGERLQAALVIDGAQAQAGANLNLVGFGLVQLSIGLTRINQAFGQMG